jgi:HprK-related kinase A
MSEVNRRAGAGQRGPHGAPPPFEARRHPHGVTTAPANAADSPAPERSRPIVGDLPLDEITRRLDGAGLDARMGPFTVRIQARGVPVGRLLHDLYRDYPLAAGESIMDLHVRLHRPHGPRRWIRPQVRFFIDGQPPFEPMGLELALPLLEWGINWVIAGRANHLLMLHAAAVERDGRALLLPGWPGHGKSTLCAALVHRGWRLLSDEFGLVDPATGDLLPLPRLMPLKNESIEVIRAFAPEARIGPSYPGTRKGTVAHVAPPAASVKASERRAPAGWIVQPRWRPEGETVLQPMGRTQTFLALATNSFNYELMRDVGFRALSGIASRCPGFLFAYTDLDDAIATLDDLPDAHEPAAFDAS